MLNSRGLPNHSWEDSARQSCFFPNVCVIIDNPKNVTGVIPTVKGKLEDPPGLVTLVK